MAREPEVSKISGWTIITVSGDLDITAAPRLRERLIETISSENSRLLLDLTAATFIDSTVLGVLVGALKRVRSNDGELRIAAHSGAVLRPLEITGLHRVFPLYPTVSAALADNS